MLRVPAGPAIPVAELSQAHNETAHVVVTMRTRTRRRWDA